MDKKCYFNNMFVRQHKMLSRHLSILCVITLCIVGRSNGQSHLGIDLLGRDRSTEIPFEIHNGLIVVKGKFASRFDMNFILDTGAGNNILLTRGFTDVLRIPYSDTLLFWGADLTKAYTAFIGLSLPIQIDTRDEVKRDFIIIDQHDTKLDESLGMTIHGILSGVFFKGLIFSIDYRRKIIKLHHPKRYKPNRNTIPVEIRQNKPYYRTTLHLQDTSITQLMLLDTGSSLPLLLRNSNKLVDSLAGESYLGIGLNGPIMGHHTTLEEMRFGPDVYKHRPLAYQEISVQMDTLVRHQKGIIGSKILQDYIVTYDYLKEVVEMEPIPKNKRLGKDRSGLIVHRRGLKKKYFVIAHVIKDSPAAIAGFKKGDIIKKYKIWPVGIFNLEQLRKRNMGNPGKKVSYLIHRAGSPHRITMILGSQEY